MEGGSTAGIKGGSAAGATLQADLIAVLVAVRDGTPAVLTLEDGALPSGPLVRGHRSLQAGLRAWVERTTGHPLGHVEQLYTFADRDRGEGGAEGEARAVSISYLALTRLIPEETGWIAWYRFLPWEDRRDPAGRRAGERFGEALRHWARAAPAPSEAAYRRQRVDVAFPETGWNDELALQRYELLYEAGLVEEAGGGRSAGLAMPRDHRRILATGIARLRAKIRYRPVFFELMPDQFTLLELQEVVEALSGVALHKPNFRRLIEQQALIEDTGAVSSARGGRPAKLFRYRREVVQARAHAGSRLPTTVPPR
ncbi:MAG: hypothetical protein INR65_06510 [Gluconacetobacter diazotrophicus]|nr:hypothetical protein [Gluconacetobacter diazotrophicus]